MNMNMIMYVRNKKKDTVIIVKQQANRRISEIENIFWMSTKEIMSKVNSVQLPVESAARAKKTTNSNL
jgi:hypothetical protein